MRSPEIDAESIQLRMTGRGSCRLTPLLCGLEALRVAKVIGPCGSHLGEMFEDRYQLWTFSRTGEREKEVTKERNGQSRGLISWKIFKSGRSGSGQPSQGSDSAQDDDNGSADIVQIFKRQMAARRSKQLRALRGWRLGYSIYLEFADVTVPIISAVILKIGNVISYLLVTLIGRSLGLIYRGVRQSLRRS
ncbi:hypothetical protein CBR_g31943 [Chara braunii]|uniref:Uncharacterized protein n=1 Tax=Chara braunii TaxID=69332 RepID=A0A388LG55_CHABU|nr:hypothetical protein CBR_g31943 [Chara braunii]|eukprot:GBG81271.1 hypothetical protein CBR_g31943 [Chara braunii]